MGFLDKLSDLGNTLLDSVNTQNADSPLGSILNAITGQGGSAQTDPVEGVDVSDKNGFLSSVYSSAKEYGEYMKFMLAVQKKTGGMTEETMDAEVASEAMMQTLLEFGADQNPDSRLGKLYLQLKPGYDRSKLPVAHATCPSVCPVNREKCAECLPLRLKALEAINCVDDPEGYRRLYSVASTAQRPTACPFCGAPLGNSGDVCEYCMTRIQAAPAERIQIQSAGEMPAPIDFALDAIYAYKNFGLEDDTTNKVKQGMTDFMPLSKTFVKSISAQVDQALRRSSQKMTEQQVIQASNRLGLSVSAYLRAFMDGKAKNFAELIYEEQQEQERQRKAEQDRKTKELQDRADEVRRRNNAEYWQRQQAMIEHRTPKYDGGGGSGAGSSSRCCGACALYMTGSASCSRDGFRKNASDYCGWFEYKR